MNASTPFIVTASPPPNDVTAAITPSSSEAFPSASPILPLLTAYPHLLTDIPRHFRRDFRPPAFRDIPIETSPALAPRSLCLSWCPHPIPISLGTSTCLAAAPSSLVAVGPPPRHRRLHSRQPLPPAPSAQPSPRRSEVLPSTVSPFMVTYLYVPDLVLAHRRLPNAPQPLHRHFAIHARASNDLSVKVLAGGRGSAATASTAPTSTDHLRPPLLHRSQKASSKFRDSATQMQRRHCKRIHINRSDVG